MHYLIDGLIEVSEKSLTKFGGHPVWLNKPQIPIKKV